VKTFGVCDFSRLAVTDWRLRRWRLWFLVLMTATRNCHGFENIKKGVSQLMFLTVHHRQLSPIRAERGTLQPDQT